MAKGELRGNISAKGKGFDGNPQNINKKGRPKTLEKALLEAGYEPFDIPINLMKLLKMTKGQLQTYSKKATLSTADMLLLKTLEQGIKKGDMKVIWDLLDRSLPKLKQEIEHSGELKTNFDTNSLTAEEKAVLLKLARKNADKT